MNDLTRKNMNNLIIRSSFIIALSALSNIVVHGQTGNVGVNTPTPANTLTVNGNTSVGSAYTGISGPSNGAIIEGNVGVGTAAPAAKLDVIGKIKITDGTEGAGKILSSDANGLASWQPAPGSVLVTGNNNQSPNFSIITPPVSEFIPDCPITLNKGMYTLYYYVQYDYFVPGTTTARPIDPTSGTTVASSFPRFIYFNFITSSGSASFPSYPAFGGNEGPHIVPTISAHQVAAKISQLVVVDQDNTVIRPRYWNIPAYGRASNIGPILAVKM
ncbi:hypothetical protein [Chryseobacterium flavum]|uniref:hypothetical protein n=1 Tax=Chryseobacterium flavum TaxID=415851 RepID=UPI0028B175B6|nr:hypothetical protein [Chryseobacterium flavum]